ncbi:malonyl-ACP O-methyltransferase BioC [Thalassotalea sp. M1531]|uniref:Malonyl-[acyl-carrier protein] O-methyltransferase n=1 Tax=Thalassotalea algicola TaxID=2716224 RepID=A0A7Y0LDD0_9GAMM|nr:malonyl-ACP O-methyltransferase BioC [Thalassotalea algicola]NMP32366.1 malonyl-ACP O-methyltransferase BioC [Thalassotalea algicola]
MPNTQNRIKIAKSFDSAIHSYDISARLQRFTGKHLMLLLPNRNDLNVIDLGCGTGFFTEVLATSYERVIGVDISNEMLNFTRRNRKGITNLVAGDAYKLPFKDNSVDLIYSNLVIQWCHPLDQAIEEIFRVLKPGGHFVFTTLLDQTLSELKSAWAQVDDDKHVIDFKTEPEVIATFNKGQSELVEHQVQDVILEYENVMHLARELKGLGANHVAEKKNRGLAGKDKWQKMTQAYTDFVEPSGIYPATYRVLSGIAIKLND